MAPATARLSGSIWMRRTSKSGTVYFIPEKTQRCGKLSKLSPKLVREEDELAWVDVERERLAGGGRVALRQPHA